MYTFGIKKALLIVVVAGLTVVTGVIVVRDGGDFLHTTFANENDPLLDAAKIDSDEDGLTDALEEDLGTNPYLKDTDNDGFSDKEEVEGGYDPLLSESDMHLDKDGDGLTGADERQFRTNPELADTDFDGTPDGVEIVQGTDPGHTEIRSLADYAGANVADQQDETLFPPVHPDDFKKIETISNATTFEEFETGLEPLVGTMPEEKSPKYSTDEVEVKVSERSDDAFVKAYFNRIGVVFAKHSPVLDMSELESLDVAADIRNPEVRADYVRRIEAALLDFEEIEVPNDQELISLHKESVRMLREARLLASDIEKQNLADPTAINNVLTLMQDSQRLLSEMQNTIFPQIQDVAARYQFDLPDSLSEFVN